MRVPPELRVGKPAR
jgi:isoleucyl-tRNA synthetase